MRSNLFIMPLIRFQPRTSCIFLNCETKKFKLNPQRTSYDSLASKLIYSKIILSCAVDRKLYIDTVLYTQKTSPTHAIRKVDHINCIALS